EHAVAAELALRHHALALLEQVGEDALVDDRHVLRGVGDDELDRDAVALALDAAGHDHSADAERAALRHFPRLDLRRREEEHQILVEGREHEGGGRAERRQAPDDHRDALVPGLHRTRSSALRLRRASRISSAATSTSVTPYEPQTYRPYPPIARKLSRLPQLMRRPSRTSPPTPFRPRA